MFCGKTFYNFPYFANIQLHHIVYGDNRSTDRVKFFVLKVLFEVYYNIRNNYFYCRNNHSYNNYR